MKKKPLIINLFGGPCTGKSTASAQIFADLKKLGLEVELVTEYAKDMTWEKRFNVLNDQIYIFAKQYRKISRLIGEVDIIIVDSPLLMCITYIRENYYQQLNPLILEVWNDCDNLNFMLQRMTNYSSIGRSQTEQEAIDKDNQIRQLLNTFHVPHHQVDVVNDIQQVYNIIYETINERNRNNV